MNAPRQEDIVRLRARCNHLEAARAEAERRARQAEARAERYRRLYRAALEAIEERDAPTVPRELAQDSGR